MTFDNGMARLIQGDCRDVLASLPERSVHMCVTSPPYWGLRSYQAAAATVWGGELGHEHKWGELETDHPSRGKRGKAPYDGKYEQRPAAQYGNGIFGQSCPCGAWCGVLGSEPTPEIYVEHMVEVFRAVKRVLRDDGTLWLNLGPTWSGSGGAGGDYADDGLRNGQPKYRAAKTDWPAKCMVPIPWMVGLALIQDGWILRSEIIWDKPAPMPESVTDRPTKSHEQILLLVKQGRYFYDAEAIKEPVSEVTIDRWGEQHERTVSVSLNNEEHRKPTGQGRTFGVDATAGRNARSVWRIAPEPSPEKHYAMFPSGLPRRCILAGTSEKGCCPECGAPWVRVVERKAMVIARTDWGEKAGNRTASSGTMVEPPEAKTVGWSPACAHGGVPVPSTVLDPFAGTATTLATAQELGRRSIGIELSPQYVEIAMKRLGSVPLAFPGA